MRCLLLRKFVLCGLLFPLWCAAVQSYTPVIHDPILEPWRWRHEEALNDLGVLCMDEAADGTLWFGNTGSIASYDGVSVKRIPFDEELLSKITHKRDRPWAMALRVLRDGNLLVLIDNSLVLRKDNEWEVILKDVGSSVFSAKLMLAPDGTFWLLVPEGLWRISGDLLTYSKVMNSSFGTELQSMCMNPAGDVWIVEKLDGLHSRLIHIPIQNGDPKVDMKQAFDIPFMHADAQGASIIADNNGLIWYGDSSIESGLIAFDPHRHEWLTREKEKILHGCYSLFKTRDGSIWSGSQGILLHSPRKGKAVLYGYEQVALPRVPLSFFEARDGRLWVIGRVGQVCSVDLRTDNWVTYEHLTFLNESLDGKQWFRLREKYTVVSYDPHHDEWLKYGPEDGVIAEPYAMVVASNGLLWIAGRHEKRAAIAVFDGTRWVRFCHPEFANWIEPGSVFEAADGTVWFGAGGVLLADIPHAGGALQYEVTEDGDVRLLKHHAPPDFPYYVTALEQTPDGTMWIGSTIVYCYDGTLPIHKVSGLGGANSVAMLLDRNQTLWLAKEDYGVCRRDGDFWRVFTAEDGLADTKMVDMIELKDGSLLVPSHQGISRFDGTSWMAKAYPKCFAMKSRRSGIKESFDGSIWFNYTNNEMWVFGQVGSKSRKCYTVRNRPEKIPPDTSIVDYLKSVAQPGNTHITWLAHDPWGRTHREDLQYSWRLNGGKWSPFSYETSKTFLELDSGMYTLEVRARDQSFNVDPTPACIEFTVIPPLWKQVWFISFVSVLVGLILLLIWLLIRTRERYLIKQQEEREKNLLERQQEQQALLVKQQEERERHLKEMDRLKTGFFTNISHELRTPMTVLSGRLQTILNSDIDEQNKDALSIVMRNAQRVSNLITQLLDFRKIEEGKIKVEATYGDLVPPLRDWVSSLQVLAEKKDISFSVECVDECRGSFDFDKVQKIFTNLISNSIKYTKAGGEVRVSLQIEERDQETRVLTFAVEDTGVGISEEHLGHIFERFYRVSEASMAVGAGIGLNLTKELVDLLGGEIRTESPIHPDAGHPGTRFTVFLPMDGEMGEDGSRRREDAKETATEPEELRAFAPSREAHPSLMGEDTPLILIVEDDEDIRNFIIEGLEVSYRVETAENGEIGLQKAKEQVPDLIVTDLMMPVMDGMTLCRELKTSLETSHIPVVMLTAKASRDHQMEGFKTGADDYITKPFHMDLLQVRIANLLASRNALREQFLREYPVISVDIPDNIQEKEFLKKAIQVVKENYTDFDFKPDDFAAALNMSISTLHRKLKAIAERTPSEFIGEFRMAQAAKLLEQSSLAIKEIVFEVGCQEAPNFSRLFKKYYKMSPSRYRETHSSR